MASHFCPQHQPKSWLESPAKVFARLKHKVQRETKWRRAGEPHKTASRPQEGGSEFSRRLQVGTSHTEAQALSLSPINSPERPAGKSPESPAEARHTLKTFLESTAMSDTLLMNPPQIGALKRCDESNVHEQSVVVDDNAFSTMKSRLRKRVLRPQCRRLRKDLDVQQLYSNHDTSMQFPAVQPEDSAVPALPAGPTETRLCSFQTCHRPTTSSAQGCCNSTMYVQNGDQQNWFHPCQIENISIRTTPDCVRDESECSPSECDSAGNASLWCDREDAHFSSKYHTGVVQNVAMSPAKVFALMKNRDNKVGPRNVPLHNKRNLNDADDVLQYRDAPLSSSQSVDDTEDSLGRVPADVLSYVEHSEEMVPIPTVPPLSDLLEYPLLLKSPKVLVPKKQQAVLKSKWPSHTKFPSENVIHLKKWCLRKLTKGLYVEGIHSSKNIRWNSNIIVERLSKSMLKTVSGSIYMLVGKLTMKGSSDFPQWLLKKFVHGFPPNWKGLYEKFQSESRNRGKQKKSVGTNDSTKKKPKVSTEKASRKKPLTPAADLSCPFGSAKVSRSGRLIIPPLDYWRGGRVMLDAYHNITIHESYQTSIIIPNAPTPQPACPTQAPVRPPIMGKKGDSARGGSTGGSRIKNPPAVNANPTTDTALKQRKSSKLGSPRVSKGWRREATTPEKPEVPIETQRKRTRLNKNLLASQGELKMNSIPQQHNRTEKSLTKRKKSKKHWTRRKNRKSPEAVVEVDESAQSLSSDADSALKRRRQRSTVQSNMGRKVPQPESPEESDKKMKKHNRAKIKAKTTGTKHPVASQPTNRLQKSTQSSQNLKVKRGKKSSQQDPDEGNWTEEELLKLKEAVLYYPRHIQGYWERVAGMVETRSAEECHNQHTSMEATQQQPKKTRRKKVEAPKTTGVPLISARAGTMKRKQQVRNFLEAMPREDVDDAFTSAYMQTKRFKLHSLDLNDDSDLMLSEMEPVTPKSACFPNVKTPQCLHITPGMIGSPNRSNDEKYIYQLQKRLKKSQFDVHKRSRLYKKFTPTPSVKKPLRQCENAGNDSFLVSEMFSGKDTNSHDSEEEEDFYFLDSD